jgi:hypothetical protein
MEQEGITLFAVMLEITANDVLNDLGFDSPFRDPFD